MDELISAELAEEIRPRALRGAGIASVAASLPERVVGNEEIAARAGVSPDWILERTGVRERRFADPGDRLTEFAAKAGLDALAAAGHRGR